MKEEILLVYLGKKGGGARLLGESVTSLLKSEVPFKVLISSSLDEVTKMLCPTKSRFEIPTFITPVQAFFRTAMYLVRLVSIYFFVRKNKICKAYFLMPHVWDFPLLLLFKFVRIHTEVVIHDPKPHLGEFFPPRILMVLESMIATKIIVLSEYSRGLILSNPKKIVLKHLPIPPRIVPTLKKEYEILFIGRAQAYKGIDLLLEAMTLPKAQDLKLTVMSSFTGTAPKSTNNVQIVNQWIHESDFEKMIASARVIVLPYRDASQSGIIPIAISNRVPCVVTPVGGLPEMIENYSCGLVSSSLYPSDILETILVCLDSNEFTFHNYSEVQTLDTYLCVSNTKRSSR
jgi:glycosyltransferase involved in cell wall biosynthesis